MDCDTCQAEPAAFILGDITTGEQRFMGLACFCRFGLEFAKSILPPEEIAAQLGPMFVAPGRAEAIAKGSRKRPSEAAPAEPEPEPAAKPAEGDDEVPAGAENG